MSTISKVIVSKSDGKYKWSQTDEAITIQMPIAGVLMKNMDIMFADHLVKVNAHSIKYFAAVDFLHEIDHKNPKTRAQHLDGRLDIYVIKKVAGRSWPTLEVQGLTKQELMKRRNECVDRFYAEQTALAKTAHDNKLAQEKKVIDEQMYVERHERKTISGAKKKQLNDRRDELFADLEDVNAKDKELSMHTKEDVARA